MGKSEAIQDTILREHLARMGLEVKSSMHGPYVWNPRTERVVSFIGHRVPRMLDGSIVSETALYALQRVALRSIGCTFNMREPWGEYWNIPASAENAFYDLRDSLPFRCLFHRIGNCGLQWRPSMPNEDYFRGRVDGM